jgi:hypothetical protein
MLQGVVLNLNMDAFDSAQVSADVHAKHLIGNRLFVPLLHVIIEQNLMDHHPSIDRCHLLLFPPALLHYSVKRILASNIF